MWTFWPPPNDPFALPTLRSHSGRRQKREEIFEEGRTFVERTNFALRSERIQGGSIVPWRQWSKLCPHSASDSGTVPLCLPAAMTVLKLAACTISPLDALKKPAKIFHDAKLRGKVFQKQLISQETRGIPPAARSQTACHNGTVCAVHAIYNRCCDKRRCDLNLPEHFIVLVAAREGGAVFAVAEKVEMDRSVGPRSLIGGVKVENNRAVVNIIERWMKL